MFFSGRIPVIYISPDPCRRCIYLLNKLLGSPLHRAPANGQQVIVDLRSWRLRRLLSVNIPNGRRNFKTMLMEEDEAMVSVEVQDLEDFGDCNCYCESKVGVGTDAISGKLRHSLKSRILSTPAIFFCRWL